jgi:hypothetical protein
MVALSKKNEFPAERPPRFFARRHTQSFGSAHSSKPSEQGGLRRRIYDELHRLESCSKDPIGFRGSKWNLFEIFGAQAVQQLDPSGEAVTVAGGCALVGTAYLVSCSVLKERFIRGTRLPNFGEKKCLDDLWGLVRPSYCKKGIVRIDPAAIEPVTKCAPSCPLITQIFLGPTDVDCKSCSGAINTLLTLLHECVHKDHQNCILENGSSDCGEYEAYKKSVIELGRDRIRLCNDMVGLGYCSSVNACQTALTNALNSEADGVSDFYWKCKKSRGGAIPIF